MNISPTIFKAYDIRGVVDKTLTEEACYAVGQVLGSMAIEQGVKSMVVARDGRLSGPKLSTSLAQGIASTGTGVINIGRAATPMLYFAAYHFKTGSGVMVTGSHNPPDYNGLKMMLDYHTLAGDDIQDIYQRIQKQQWVTADKSESIIEENIATHYLERIKSDVKLTRPLKIIIDCGNGITGMIAPDLFRALGCEVEVLFGEVDGNFPNHHPDPSQPDNLIDLQKALRNSDAEIGLAFDGDGDRVGVVTKAGDIIYPDRQLMLFAADVLTRHPGAKIIYDVKSTRLLKPWIQQHGGEPVLSRTGHSFIKATMKETGALLAGEMSGHVFFKERWYGFDDGLYAGCRLLEYLSKQESIEKVWRDLPNSINTPELTISTVEGENHKIISNLQALLKTDNLFPTAQEIITIDGLRVEYKDGFGLLRASNTTPTLVLRFEADSQDALKRIQNDWKQVILKVWPEATIGF